MAVGKRCRPVMFETQPMLKPTQATRTQGKPIGVSYNEAATEVAILATLAGLARKARSIEDKAAYSAQLLGNLTREEDRAGRTWAALGETTLHKLRVQAAQCFAGWQAEMEEASSGEQPATGEVVLSAPAPCPGEERRGEADGDRKDQEEKNDEQEATSTMTCPRAGRDQRSSEEEKE